MTAPTSPRSRADVNRANSQHSTGPSSSAGKARSAQNSFKHGLYSKQLILPGEDPAEFDELRASLRHEHQPANTTEEILVDELAQSFWRMRRFRALEARGWAPQNLNNWVDSGLMTQVHRASNSAERSFHKSLTALQKLQKRTGRESAPPIKRSDSADLGAGRESVVRDQEKARGFVPQKPVEEQSTTEETGFVPAESPMDAAAEPTPPGFVLQKTAAELEVFKHMGYFPEDLEKIIGPLVDSDRDLTDNTETAA